MSFAYPLFRRFGLSLSHFRVAAGERVRGHRHANTHLMFLLDGEASEKSGRGAVQLATLSARYSGADAVHDMEFGPGGGECLVVHFGSTRRQGAGSDFLPASIARGHAERLAAYMRAPERAPLALLEALFAGAQLPRAEQCAPDWLHHVRALLLAPEPTRVACAARDAGVSREHLSRAFVAHYGAAPQLTRRCARLANAAGLLLRTMSESTEIAHFSGYADQSHFIRDFRWAFGVTPERFRRARQAAHHNRSIAGP